MSFSQIRQWFFGHNVSKNRIKQNDSPKLLVQRGSVKSTHAEWKASPVSRLHYDILVIVFNYAWEFGHFTADYKGRWTHMVLASVCRRWRDIALSIPRVWSQLPYPEFANENYLQMVLNRSYPLPLHVALSKRTHATQYRVLCAFTDRIQCLKIQKGAQFLENVFPILERLDLNMMFTDVPKFSTKLKELGLLEVSRFPKLQEFHFARDIYPLNQAVTISTKQLPPLQVLSIKCYRGTDWISLVNRLDQTLISLSLTMEEPGEDGRLVLPRLRQLLITEMNMVIKIHLHVDAPRLESVYRYSYTEPELIVLELSHPQTVTSLYVRIASANLTHYPHLHTLWIQSNGLRLHLVKDMLNDSVQNCLHLTSIRYACDYLGTQPFLKGDDDAELKQIVEDASLASGRPILVDKFNPDHIPHPGAFECNTHCYTVWKIWSNIF